MSPTSIWLENCSKKIKVIGYFSFVSIVFVQLMIIAHLELVFSFHPRTTYQFYGHVNQNQRYRCNHSTKSTAHLSVPFKCFGWREEEKNAKSKIATITIESVQISFAKRWERLWTGVCTYIISVLPCHLGGI